MKLRRLRDGDVLDDGEVLLVRGGKLDPEVLRSDAERYHSIYGSYGISVFAVRDVTWIPGGHVMDPEIDLVADLNAEDDDGLGWSVLRDARDPARVRPGAMLLAGNRHAKAVVRVVAVD